MTVLEKWMLLKIQVMSKVCIDLETNKKVHQCWQVGHDKSSIFFLSENVALKMMQYVKYDEMLSCKKTELDDL